MLQYRAAGAVCASIGVYVMCNDVGRLDSTSKKPQLWVYVPKLLYFTVKTAFLLITFLILKITRFIYGLLHLFFLQTGICWVALVCAHWQVGMRAAELWHILLYIRMKTASIVVTKCLVL